jgi:pSer/pThr/pTyr-binding forkhead associated (FHA) protein
LRLKHPSFALLIINQPEPIVIESNEPHILGRFGAEGGVETRGAIDLTDYEAVELGVSRYHAEISYTGEAFVLRDLDSTNGTWLNHNRLTPGSSYILNSDDRIVLGRLVIWVCVSKAETEPLE